MKRSLFFIWICASAFTLSAQNIPLFAGEYVPFHQFILQNKPVDNVPGMPNGNQLKDFVGTFEIASLHYAYISQPSDSGWNVVDSSTFFYKDSLPFPVADTMLAYTATNQSWAYDSEFSISSYYIPSQPVTDQDSFQGSKTWKAYNSGSSAWSNTYNYNYGYDANQRLISFATQTWNSSSWTTVDSMSVIYNSSGLDSIRSVFTFSSGVVQNDTQYAYFYNDNIYDANNRDSIIIISVNGVQYQRYLYQYTPLSYLFTGIDISVWNDTVWNRYGLYSYTRNNNQETYLLQLWDTGTSQYVNTYEESLTLDYRNNVLSFENDNFNGNTPVPLVQYTYSYDIDNDLTFEQDAYWNTGAGSYTATDQYYYYYQWMPALGINTVKNDLGAEIFPNPSNSHANIQIIADVSSSLLISVFDASGRKINEISTSVVTGNNILPLQLNQLAAGSYLINLRTANGKSTTLNWVKE